MAWEANSISASTVNHIGTHESITSLFSVTIINYLSASNTSLLKSRVRRHLTIFSTPNRPFPVHE